MKSTRNKTRVWVTPKLNLFKNVVAGCSLLLLLPAARAQFTWPVYEPFGEYLLEPQKLGATESMTNWNFGNSSNGTNGVSTYVITSTNAMSYPALMADPNGVPKGLQEVPTSSTSADRGATFSTNTGTWYASLLLNYQDNGGATGDRLAYNVVSGASISNSLTRAWTAIWLTPDYRLRVTKNYNAANDVRTANFSDATPVLATNIPHLIVMRYLKGPSGIDEVALWVDPTPFGDDASIPPPTLTTTNAPNVTYFNGFMLSNRKLNGQPSYWMNVFQVDEIRMGSTWSSVTPLATPAPGPMFSVTGGGIGCPGDSFPVIVSGSVATNDYRLYTNSVYAQVTMTGNGDGSALNLGAFSNPGVYSVLASNNVNGNLGWMSNSVTIVVRAPVNIVTQPVPAITATNSRAQFSVVCTGDQLSYQWYKDGSALTNDSHLTGATAATLVIWPATDADIGGYSCSITNPCSTTPSLTTTVSLTLGAPKNLVWAGSTFGQNFWDIGTTAVWNDGGGATVFNEGDNVTFDDTYNGAQYGAVITLTGILTPSQINYNAAQQLFWAGNGTLAGTASLIKNGTGRLVISNTVSAGVYLANPYTGGTFITNGTVYVQSAYALGTGPITLAGGALETLGKLSFSNSVSVAADSVCQLDQSGNQSITLWAPLIGSPGTTLVFTNSSSVSNSPNWVNLNAPFTNNSAIVLAVSGITSNSTQRLVLTADPNSAQVLNGVISEVFVPSIPTGWGAVTKMGAGAAYLNAANTYTGGTTNGAGLLAGSGSINSRLDVGPGGSLGGGSATAIGTFTVNSNITLNGNVFVRVDKALAQSNDMVVATGIITNGGTGTVTLTNIGTAAIAPGDTFKIFSGPVSNGAALAVNDGNLTVWANNLAIDGTVQAVSVIPSYPTNISSTISGTTLTVAWPQTHLGWILQVNTNSVVTNRWFDIPNTASVTSTNIPVNGVNPLSFYRLRHP